ncbi:MAG TPA: hypothetical protein VGM44_12830 [Polyangiaceae bacterium]
MSRTEWTLRAASAFSVALLAGCAGKSTASDTPASTPAASTAPATNDGDLPCLAGDSVKSLYSGVVTGLGISSDQVVITSDRVLRVPLAGGDAVTLATPESPYGLLLLGDRAYFEASHPDGAPVGAKQPTGETLDSVPVTGGDASTALSEDLAPSPFEGASDADSMYFPARSASSAVTRFTPPSTRTDLGLSGPSLLINAIAVFGSYVYVAGDDISGGGGLSNGLIVRVPKSGGDMQRLLTNIGHPWNLTVDASGLYWIQDPQQFEGGAQLMHSNLDGTESTNLLWTTINPVSVSSFAIGGDQIYFTEGDVVASIPVAGGPMTTIASGQNSPGMLTAAGQNVVWLAPASQALSDPTVPQVFTACAPQR